MPKSHPEFKHRHLLKKLAQNSHYLEKLTRLRQKEVARAMNLEQEIDRCQKSLKHVVTDLQHWRTVIIKVDEELRQFQKELSSLNSSGRAKKNLLFPI